MYIAITKYSRNSEFERLNKGWKRENLTIK